MKGIVKQLLGLFGAGILGILLLLLLAVWQAEREKKESERDR